MAALKHALEQERADQLAHVEASRRAFDVQKSAAGKRYQVGAVGLRCGELPWVGCRRSSSFHSSQDHRRVRAPHASVSVWFGPTPPDLLGDILWTHAHWCCPLAPVPGSGRVLFSQASISASTCGEEASAAMHQQLEGLECKAIVGSNWIGICRRPDLCRPRAMFPTTILKPLANTTRDKANTHRTADSAVRGLYSVRCLEARL